MAKKEKFSLNELMEQALVKDNDKPYELPSNWRWTRFGNIIDFPKDKFNPEVRDSELKYIGLEHLEKNRGIIDVGSSSEINSTKNVFKEDDIIYGRLRPYLNKHDIAKFNGICSTDILVFRCSKTICNSKFINYYLDTDNVIQYTVANSKGINLPRVSEKELSVMQFPLPPFPEQQRIVTLIESLFIKLDLAKELVQNALNSFENRKSAILHKAFTGKLTAIWREENEVIESAEALFDRILKYKNNSNTKSNGEILRTSNANIPKKWVATNLGMVVKDFKYGVSEKSDVSYNGIPVIRIPNVISNKLDFTNLKYLNHKDINEANLLQEDDLLIIRSNGSRDLVGKCALVGILDKSYTFASYLIRIRPIIVNAKYLLYLLNSSYIRNQFFKKSKSSAGINNINSQELNSVFIPLPPMAEQNEIVQILDNILENEQKTKELCDVIENIDNMKKSILARAFRGELNTNNPNEESALELLKKILKEKKELMF